ncbi:MAG: hypothetical protein ACKVP4_04250 [Hyphomicrobium sp.]
MFDAFLPSAKRLTVDIGAVRDTLKYLEGDLRQKSEYARLAETLRTALVEIDRLEKSGVKAPPVPSPVVASQFRPIDM